MGYSLEERCAMVEIFIACGKNKAASQREFIRRFPVVRVPAKNTFRNLYNKFMANHSLADEKRERARMLLTDDVELSVLLYFIEDDRRSLRMAQDHLGISSRNIHKILKKYKYKPFKFLQCQKLYPQDMERRVNFCQEIVLMSELDRSFCDKILFSDECSFSTVHRLNRKNEHSWAIENPHLVHPLKQQGWSSVNVWCGMLNNRILGPVFIEGRLDGESYLNYLRNEIEGLLDNEIPLRRRFQVVWQQDGAPAHNANFVRQYLDQRYAVWIGNGGPILWPARSPDLTPLDFFLWGTIKNNIYKEEIQDVNILREKIVQEVAILNNNPYCLQQVRAHFLKRCRLCIEKSGAHIENFL